MARQIQIRRGTAEEHDAFTGAIGEVTMDTTNNTLRVHDGETIGGTVLAKKSEIPDLTTMDYVVETQTPNAENNFTWYRKYKSGWVEQGGRTNGTTQVPTIILAVPMLDNSYTIHLTRRTNNTADDPASISLQVRMVTATSFQIRQTYTTTAGGGLGSGASYACNWTVCGMARN